MTQKKPALPRKIKLATLETTTPGWQIDVEVDYTKGGPSIWGNGNVRRGYYLGLQPYEGKDGIRSYELFGKRGGMSTFIEAANVFKHGRLVELSHGIMESNTYHDLLSRLLQKSELVLKTDEAPTVAAAFVEPVLEAMDSTIRGINAMADAIAGMEPEPDPTDFEPHAHPADREASNEWFESNGVTLAAPRVEAPCAECGDVLPIVSGKTVEHGAITGYAEATECPGSNQPPAPDDVLEEGIPDGFSSWHEAAQTVSPHDLITEEDIEESAA